MKNTLTINTNGKFEVECVDMVDSGSNSIILNVITGENPESLYIYLNDTLITTFSGLISASENPFIVPEDCYVADSLLKIQYGSDSFLLFSFPSSIIGNMTVTQASDLSFSVKYSYPGNTDYKMCIIPGDSISWETNAAFSGFLSDSSRGIYFSIPLNKPVVDVSKVTLSGKVAVRSTTGALLNPKTNLAIYDLSNAATEEFTIVTLLRTSMIACRILCNSATNGTNHTVLSVATSGILTATFE